MKLTPIEFLAKLTLHIPDRYQNIRRYAGFYASIVQYAVRKASTVNGSVLPRFHEVGAVKPRWAVLIAKMFGSLPVSCTKCGAVMELKEFIFNDRLIAKLFPDIARAPPRFQFDRYVQPTGEPVYTYVDDKDSSSAEFNQLPQDNDAFYNQENAW